MFNKIIKEYQELNFISGEAFSWNPQNKTITYRQKENDDNFLASLMHEIAHAKLNHSFFKYDINLLKMERDAWAMASLLIENFRTSLDQNYVEDCMDSYRDWLYSRSKCPKCHYLGIQSDINTYSCIYCSIAWRVPDSRLCTIKRKILT